jgi:hypothetical protein
LLYCGALDHSADGIPRPDIAIWQNAQEFAGHKYPHLWVDHLNCGSENDQIWKTSFTPTIFGQKTPERWCNSTSLFDAPAVDVVTVNCLTNILKVPSMLDVSGLNLGPDIGNPN